MSSVRKFSFVFISMFLTTLLLTQDLFSLEELNKAIEELETETNPPPTATKQISEFITSMNNLLNSAANNKLTTLEPTEYIASLENLPLDSPGSLAALRVSLKETQDELDRLDRIIISCLRDQHALQNCINRGVEKLVKAERNPDVVKEIATVINRSNTVQQDLLEMQVKSAAMLKEKLNLLAGAGPMKDPRSPAEKEKQLIDDFLDGKSGYLQLHKPDPSKTFATEYAGKIPDKVEELLGELKATPELLAAFGITNQKNHTLFLGPPGTGKTHIMSCISNEMHKEKGMYMFEFNLAGVPGEFIQVFPNNVEGVFRGVYELAKKLGKPVILKLEEADDLVSDRSTGNEDTQATLAHMAQRYLETKPAGAPFADYGKWVKFFGSTNHPDDFKAAAFERMNKIAIGLPNAEQRTAILTQKTNTIPKEILDITDEDIIRLANQELKGCSARVITNMTERAKKNALMRFLKEETRLVEEIQALSGEIDAIKSSEESENDRKCELANLEERLSKHQEELIEVRRPDSKVRKIKYELLKQIISEEKLLEKLERGKMSSEVQRAMFT